MLQFCQLSYVMTNGDFLKISLCNAFHNAWMFFILYHKHSLGWLWLIIEMPFARSELILQKCFTFSFISKIVQTCTLNFLIFGYNNQCIFLYARLQTRQVYALPDILIHILFIRLLLNNLRPQVWILTNPFSKQLGMMLRPWIWAEEAYQCLLTRQPIILYINLF
jgi:hypothetical protein